MLLLQKPKEVQTQMNRQDGLAKILFSNTILITLL